jgi:hypothetical protein
MVFTIVEDMAAVSLAAKRLQATKFPSVASCPLCDLKRYHYQLGLHPDYVPNFDEPIHLVLSQHAIRGAQREMERKGVDIMLPTQVDFSKVTLVEQGIRNGVLDRVLVRMAHDATWDLVMSISMRGKSKWLITAWANRSSDRHYTLDESLYERA